MKTYVITKNVIEGTHYFKDADIPVKYLANEHRHLFYINCKWKVKHDDRDIEIICQQHLLSNYIKDNYGAPATFGNMSCEMIAKNIVQFFDNCIECEVLEDNQGGAVVIK